tara:strand:+ start:285 stop:542 length:258 start_codon:yes stop_codon:yes gene_type:complete
MSDNYLNGLRKAVYTLCGVITSLAAIIVTLNQSNIQNLNERTAVLESGKKACEARYLRSQSDQADLREELARLNGFRLGKESNDE